jgi:asparaginyl-tRNA synthetase
MAFYDLQDNMELAEEFVKYLVQYALDNCMEDLKFLNDKYGIDPDPFETGVFNW